MAGLTLDRVIGGLRRVDWAGLGVRWVVLFGGLARRGRGRDVDLLVAPGPGARDTLSLVVAVSEALDVDPGLVDIVPLEAAPCTVILDAWRSRIIIYERRRGEALDGLLVRASVCIDYRIMARKLRVTRSAAEAMIRRWGEWGR